MKKNTSPENTISERSVVIRSAVKRILSVALLLFAVVLSWRTAWVISTTLLDSDASSNLILGAKLAREGGIFSSSFIYATELNVVDIQIVYSLLFRICQDWSLVRFFGAIILQSLMLWAYGYLACQSKMSFNAFCITAAAMLLPFSVPYGRIVLYHNYYILHITLDLWIVGLYFSVSRKIAGFRRAKREDVSSAKRMILRLSIPSVLLCLVAFGAGLGGVRQLMICAAPLLVTSLVCAMAEEKAPSGESAISRLGAVWPSLLPALCMTLCCALGYFVNTQVLANLYTFTSYSNQTLSLVSVTGLETIFRGFLTAIGYQENIPLFTLHGLLSVGSVAAVLITLILSIHTLRHTQDHAARFLQIYMGINLLVITCVFAFLATGEFTYELYYLPVIVWILPALGKADLRAAKEDVFLSPSSPASGHLARILGKGSPSLSVHGLISLLACALIFFSGLYYSCFFRHPADYASEVDYSGLRVHDPFTVEGLQPVADYLKKEGYTLCYTSYWEGAVLTELTDGQVRSVSIEPGGRRKVIQYQQWLADTLLWDQEYIKDRKACILASYDLSTALEDAEEIMGSAVERETIGGYTVYELTDATVIARYLD